MTGEELRELWAERDKRYVMRRLQLSEVELATVRDFRRREIARMVELATEHTHLLKEVATWMPPR